jgi:hypothetical protein
VLVLFKQLKVPVAVEVEVIILEQVKLEVLVEVEVDHTKVNPLV